jgi:fatty acyl-CoA reductase
MSAEEKAAFHFDVRSIDWTDYITNVHIPGLRKHVMKGRGVTASASASAAASPSSSATVLAGASTTV